MTHLGEKAFKKNEKISWRAHEFKEAERNADWFWAVGLIAVSLSVIAFVFINFLLGILIIVTTIALILNAVRKPEFVTFAFDNEGFSIENERHSYEDLHSFGISDASGEKKLIIRTHKFFAPYFVVPLEGVDENSVREKLSAHIPEEDLHEPVSHMIMEYLGF